MQFLPSILSSSPFPHVVVRAHVDRPDWFVAEVEVEGRYVSAVAPSPGEALDVLDSALAFRPESGDYHV